MWFIPKFGKAGQMGLKRVIGIFFDQYPNERLDLFQAFPALKQILQRRKLHASIRTIGDVVFTFIILSGLFGPQDPHENIVIFLSWGLWWPSMVLSWFFVGRMWCGFCPFPGLGRVLQRLGWVRYRPVPRWLQKYGIYWAVFLFAVIIWLEESMGIKESPRATALLILAILGGATFFSILYPLQAWCRYLCPMGRITGVASTMSMTEFRPDHSICKGCTSFACKRGRDGQRGCPVYLGAFGVTNNLDCLICGRCVSLCDKNSPRINFRSPFAELLISKGRYITCSYIIPLLLASQLARFMDAGILKAFEPADYSTVYRMAMFSGLLLFWFVMTVMFLKLGAKVFGTTEDELFGRFSPMVPVFVPTAFAGELVCRLNYALHEAQFFFPTLGRQFGLDLSSWEFHVPFWIYPLLDLFLVISSVAAGLHVLHRLVYGDFYGMVSPLRHRLCELLVYGMGATYIILLPFWYAPI